MKKTLTTVLIFAVVMAALLGVAALAERLGPQPDPAAADEAPQAETVTNAMNETKATRISLSDDGVSFLGVGAEYSGGVVTIRYPGTYRVEGTLTSGQLVVDLGDYDGAVYLIMDGVSVSCPDGPGLYVRQADLTVLHLTEGTVNTIRDGEDYVIEEKQETKTGAGIYSCDELRIEGEGALNVSGNVSDGIRSKDGLTITGGAVSVYSQDDGLQGSDYVDISGGSVVVVTYGDGISTTEGYVTISGGAVDLTCAGDGVSAATELNVTGGRVTVLAHGGSSYYAAVALGGLSAKGVKAQDIAVTGGALSLNTADDAVHAQNSLSISGGSLFIDSGDDALKSKGTMSVTGGIVRISESYEGLDAETVSLDGASVTVTAQNNGVDAGEGGFTARGSELSITAPRAVSCGGKLYLRDTTIDLTADGADSLFSFKEAELVGATVIAGAGTNDASVLTEKGGLPDSLLFVFREPVAAGAQYELTDALGHALMTFSRADEVSAVLVTSGAFLEGQEYTLTVTEPAQAAEESGGESTAEPAEAEPTEAEPVTMTGTVGEGCAVVEPEGGLAVRQGGFPGFPGGGFPGFPGGPGRP